MILKKLLFLLVLGLPLLAFSQRKTRIACVGDESAFGVGISALQKELGSAYQVDRYSFAGATALRKPGKAFWRSPAHLAALKSEPDLVFIGLGTNDSKPGLSSGLSAFDTDYRELICSFAALRSHPRIVLLLPPAISDRNAPGADSLVLKTINPRIERVAFAESVELVDLHRLFAGRDSGKPGPGRSGISRIAARLAEAVVQTTSDAYDIFTRIDAEKTISSFHGYRQADFNYRRMDCKVVQPKHDAQGRPWIWRARFWDHEPQVDIELLQRGFHLVYCDIAELYGNQRAVDLWNGFYGLLTAAGLSKKAVLEGFSRGAVYAYNWAAQNPGKVACVYADNPVLDLESWPGGKGTGPGSKEEWQTVKADYGLATEIESSTFRGSPINRVSEIVKGRYPMLHLLADADEVVPPKENTLPFAAKVNAAGGKIRVYHKPGFRHHPHSLADPELIVRFILHAVKR